MICGFITKLHSIHFIYGYIEGNVLFNDAFNILYLRLKDHSDSKRGNLLLPHGLFVLISSKFFFNMHHPTDRITHTTAFVIPIVGHWLE